MTSARKSLAAAKSVSLSRKASRGKRPISVCTSLSGQMKSVTESAGKVNEQTEGMSNRLQAISDRTEKVGELSQRMQVVTERTGRMDELSVQMRGLSEQLEAVEKKVEE